MLEPDQLKFAAEDARARHTALVQLIYFTEQQATSLLRLYITLAVAAASAAVAGWGGQSIISGPLTWGLGAAAIVLIAASMQCYRAMAPAEIGLPGRGPEFWLWALNDDGVDYKHALTTYLRNLDETINKDRETNRRAGAALKWAKRIGIGAAPAAVIVGAAAVIVVR